MGRKIHGSPGDSRIAEISLYQQRGIVMKTLRKLVNWISSCLERVDEMAPKVVERRITKDRRVSCVGYVGPERRSGSDRRKSTVSGA